MAIDSVMASALTGLQAAQTGLTTVSNNIANMNTPGYAREVVQLSPLVAAGVGSGVTVDDVERVTSQFLEQANLTASSAAGSASIVSNLLDQAQAAFGDPSSASSYLNQLSSVFSDFAAAANQPASSLPRSQVVDDLTNFLNTTQTVSGSLAGLGTQASTQIGSDVGQINQLLSQISTLNQNITAATADGADASASQDSQSQLIDQLSSLMQVNISTQTDGSTVVRSASGQLLAGPDGSATLTYTPSVSGFGSISVVQPADPQSSTLSIGSGELQGLLTLSNTLIPGIQAQLGSYVGGAVSAINAAYNANTAVPAPQTLTGRDTGLDLPTIVGDFTGTTNVAIVDASGNVAQQVQINFSTGQMSVNGGGPSIGFTPSTFLTSLNQALGGQGTASFANGALSISAANSGDGVAIANDPTTPSQDGGQGFSQFFGLNDLLSSNQISNFNTGLKLTDASGFNGGGQITFQVANSTGTPLNTVTVAVPSSPQTMQDVVNALNAPIGGLGQYGQFSLSSAGALTFSSSSGAQIAVTGDTTQWGVGGSSMTQLFGLGAQQQAGVATAFQIQPSVAANPMNMALARLNLTAAAAGEPALAIGDGSGATALSQAANAAISFAAAGNLPSQTTTVAQYGANLGGAIGQQASAADDANSAAQAVQTEATNRLQSVEGVNLDEEMVNMTTYQQAYNASARLIQASQDMLNTLLQMVQ